MSFCKCASTPSSNPIMLEFSPEEIVMSILSRYKLSIRNLAVHIGMNESTLAKKLNRSPAYARPAAKKKAGYKPRYLYLEDYELEAIVNYIKSHSHGDLPNLSIAHLQQGQLFLGSTSR